MELADVTDSKSVGSDTVRVRPPPSAPEERPLQRLPLRRFLFWNCDARGRKDDPTAVGEKQSGGLFFSRGQTPAIGTRIKTSAVLSAEVFIYICRINCLSLRYCFLMRDNEGAQLCGGVTRFCKVAAPEIFAEKCRTVAVTRSDR